MKPVTFLCALVAVYFCVVLNSRLEQRELELATATARIHAEEERGPRSELSSAQRDLTLAERKILALEDQLRNSQGQVAALSDRITEIETRPNIPHPGRPRPVAKAGLVKGGFRILEENVVYLPDSQFRLGDDLMVTSLQGMMMSDKEQTIFGGDLLLQTSQGTIEGEDAVLEVHGDSAVLTGKQVKLVLRKRADGEAPVDRPGAR